MARKSKYDREVIITEIVERLSKGETLRAICRDEHMPEWRKVYEWQDENEDFKARIARARELGFDAIAEGTIDIVDEPPERGPDGRVDSGYVQWQKNRAYQRMQLLSKWSPKKYGERQHLEHSGKLGLEALIADDE
jgi:hypothetical protein